MIRLVIYMNLGKRIRSLRIDNKMTQEELGRRLGVNRAAINKYEKGTVTNIPTDALLTMCAIFDVTPNYLLLGEMPDIQNSALREIRIMIGAEGMECIALLAGMSSSGRVRAIQYLEDLKKLYPKSQDSV